MFKANNEHTRTTKVAWFLCLNCLNYLLKVKNRNTRTYFTSCSSVSIVNFEQVNADWGLSFKQHRQYYHHQYHHQVTLLKKTRFKYNLFYSAKKMVQSCECIMLIKTNLFCELYLVQVSFAYLKMTIKTHGQLSLWNKRSALGWLPIKFSKMIQK